MPLCQWDGCTELAHKAGLFHLLLLFKGREGRRAVPATSSPELKVFRGFWNVSAWEPAAWVGSKVGPPERNGMWALLRPLRNHRTMAETDSILSLGLGILKA